MPGVKVKVRLSKGRHLVIDLQALKSIFDSVDELR